MDRSERLRRDRASREPRPLPSLAPPRLTAPLIAPALLAEADLARLAEAARDPAPLALLCAADAVARAATGQRLCTAMRFDAAAMTVQRIYSSDPAAYPVGGAKPKRDTAWGRQVLLEHRVFAGEGEATIRTHFDDHALILGLGLRSIVNVPVLRQGVCAGTLNFLWSQEQVLPAWIAVAELLAQATAQAWG
jgi:hypothetical protein